MIIPAPTNTTYKWLSKNDGSVKNNTNVLMLTGSLAIDGSNYTCLVDSSQLYSPIKKNITVTVQGIIIFKMKCHCISL